MKKLTLLWLTTLLISGCGEFSYKRGASVRDLENTKKTCQSSSEQAMEKCLNAHGWVVKKLDTLEFISGDISKDAPDDLASVSTSPATETQPAQKTADAAKTLPSDTTPTSTQPSTKQAAAPIAQRDPFETVKISSWWKTGGNDTKFQADIQQCKTQLGVAHTPDMAKQLYTRAFVGCMYSHGWKALGKAK